MVKKINQTGIVLYNERGPGPTLGQVLAQGAFGAIYQDPSDRDYVIKLIQLKNEQEGWNVYSEYKVSEFMGKIQIRMSPYDITKASLVKQRIINPAPKANSDRYFINSNLADQIKAKSNIFMSYRMEKISVDWERRVLREPILLFVSLYQLVEIYQGLISSNINFGHHDLHTNNVGYVTDGKWFGVKLIDFGFSCLYQSGKTRSAVKLNDGKTSSFGHTQNGVDHELKPEEHAVIDLLHLIARCYLTLTDLNHTVRDWLWGQLECKTCSCCLELCKKDADLDTLFNDFYFRNRVIECNMHRRGSLEGLKSELLNRIMEMAAENDAKNKMELD